MARLPKGVFKRGDSFYTRLYGGGQDRWVSLGTDYEDAKRRLKSVREGGAPEKRKVEEAVAAWQESYVRVARNEEGFRLARTRSTAYLIPYMGRWDLSNIDADTMRRYRQWLEAKPISRQTVAHILSDARCFFGWCADSGLIAKSPVPKRLLPRIQERPPDRLTPEQVAVLEALPEPWGWIVRLGVGTGLRWGELTRAQSTDVRGGWLTVHQTKSGKVRRVPLSPELRQELAGRVGKLVPYGEQSSGAFNTAVKGLVDFRFHVHQTRHTFACQWLERGGSLAALQQLMGHSSIVTTQRYAKLMDEVVMAEAERIAARPVAKPVATEGNEENQDTRKSA